MGGLGSGGWNHSGRATVEDTATLTIAALRKRGGLRSGAHTIWRWSRGGHAFASIGVHGGCENIRLSYSVCENSGESQRIEEHVALAYRPCRFGGQRPFFRCPRCGRDVAALHLRGARFVCRTCGRLTYASRRERERDRNLRAANRLRGRLGGDAGALNPIAERPRRMWRRTYDRLVAEIERREGRAFEELAGWMTRTARRRTEGFWR